MINQVNARDAQAFQALFEGQNRMGQADQALIQQFLAFRGEAMRNLEELQRENVALRVEGKRLQGAYETEIKTAETAIADFQRRILDLERQNEALRNERGLQEVELGKLRNRPPCLDERHAEMEKMNLQRLQKHGTKLSKKSRRTWNKQHPDNKIWIR